MKNYGLGSLMTIPSGATPSPFQFATLKDTSLDLSTDLDELRGEKLFAIDAAKKGGKIGGKIKVCQLDPDAIAQIIPGITKTTGTVRGIRDESATVPAPSGPYTVTVAQSATWSVDLGVVDTTTGLPMTRGASATGTGVYSVAAGVYTFHSTDASKAVKISYTYTVAGSGSTFTLDNSLMTTATPMAMYLFNVAGGQNTMVRLPAVHIPKLGFGLKSEGWAEYDLEYQAVADANGKVAYIYSDEA